MARKGRRSKKSRRGHAKTRTKHTKRGCKKGNFSKRQKKSLRRTFNKALDKCSSKKCVLAELKRNM